MTTQNKWMPSGTQIADALDKGAYFMQDFAPGTDVQVVISELVAVTTSVAETGLPRYRTLVDLTSIRPSLPPPGLMRHVTRISRFGGVPAFYTAFHTGDSAFAPFNARITGVDLEDAQKLANTYMTLINIYAVKEG